MGLSPISITSSKQTVTATFDAATSAYAFTGLVQGAGLAATDMVTVTSGPAMVQVPAPPPFASIATALGTPAGLATTFNAPDGMFDVVTVFAGTSGSPQSGAMCTFQSANMTLTGGMRTTPLVDAATVTQLKALNIVPTTVYVAYAKQVMSSAFWSGQPAIGVQAARMLQVPASALGL
jgi:hypothetical protein